MCYMEMVPSTEGRPRGRATMGRDAAPPGVTRNRVPGRFSERPTAWAHYIGRPRSETRIRLIAEDAAHGAPRGAGRIERPVRPNKSGANRTTRVTGAPSRRAIPLAWGTGKEKGLRANPRARIKTGADVVWLFDN